MMMWRRIGDLWIEFQVFFSKSLNIVHRDFKRYWSVLLIPLAWILTDHFGVALNMSQSLPQKVWLVHLKQMPQRGDYVVFRAPLRTGLERGSTVIKQVKGIMMFVESNLPPNPVSMIA